MRSHLLAFLLLPLIAHAEVRTLTDKQGRSLQADVIEVTADTVKIKRADGQLFDLPLSTLTETDQKILRELATKLATEISPTAIAVALSRAKFSTDSKDIDITLTDGTKVKGGQTITTDKWGYSISITNKTPKLISTLRAEYRLFATVDSVHTEADKSKLKKKAFTSPIAAIAPLGKIEFRSETIAAVKTKYNGNIVSAKTGDSTSRETLHGIWLRIYAGDTLVHESAFPETLMKTEKW
jgi:hypothetical protein